MRLAIICHRCKHSSFKSGSMICEIDDQPVVEHAREYYCPAGFYELGLGDLAAKVIHKSGTGKLFRKIKKWRTGSASCKGCKTTQLALNPPQAPA